MSKIKNKILIVDDNQPLLDTITEILKLNNFISQTATTGKECLKKINSFKPDLVLLDIWLPDIDGFKICKDMKKTPKTSKIPVIFITGDKTIDIDKSFASGADDCIIKPIEPDYLISCMSKLLDINRNILILDDDRQLCDMLQKILTRKKFNVSVLYEGSDIIKHIKTFKPNIVLLDISLPIGPGGFEICKDIKNSPDTKDTTIIMMTAREDIESVDSCFKAGAEDYIFKPFNLDDLLTRIKKNVYKRRD